MPIIQEIPLVPRNLTVRTFRRIANRVLNKYAICPLFNGLEVFHSTSDKSKLFAKNFSKNSDLDKSDTSFTCFPV